MNDEEKQRAPQVARDAAPSDVHVHELRLVFQRYLSGIETVQVIQYAARALQLAEQVSGQKTRSRNF